MHFILFPSIFTVKHFRKERAKERRAKEERAKEERAKEEEAKDERAIEKSKSKFKAPGYFEGCDLQ